MLGGVRFCRPLTCHWPALAQRHKVYTVTCHIVQTTHAKAAEPAMTTSPAQAITFLTLLHSLKKTKRTGWIRRDIAGPESIADHMYRMSMMALLGGASNVDMNRCIKLAITHDVAEAIVGDIAPSDNVTKEVKNQLEAEAMVRIKEMLGAETAAGQEVEALWQEYEDGQSAEAVMVKDFDKLEMILQAQEYEADQGVNLQEFFDSTAGKFKTPLGQAWAKEIIKRRTAQITDDKKSSDANLQEGTTA